MFPGFCDSWFPAGFSRKEVLVMDERVKGKIPDYFSLSYLLHSSSSTRQAAGVPSSTT